MLNTLKKKLNKKKGFTLMEMLIVVAIIAILIAIAIPTFSSQLEKAREATDEANVRSAYAVAQACLLTNQDPSGTAGPSMDSTKLTYYMKKDGSFTTTKGTDCYVLQAAKKLAVSTVPGFDGTADTKGHYITITFTQTTTKDIATAVVGHSA